MAEYPILKDVKESMYVRLTLLLIIGLTVLRGVGAATWPLSIDEAYYWLWSRHLDWSYLDHPPMIAYIISFFTHLGDAALWVRMGPLLLGAATTYVLFLLGRDLFDARTGFLAAVLYQALPVVGVLAVPDTPLFLAWVMTLRFVWQALHARPSRWPAAGLTLGLGMMSKFHMAFVALGLAAFLLLRARAWLRRPELYGAAALALLVLVPVLYWNAMHEWATIRFVLHERPQQITVLAGDVPGTGLARYFFHLGTTPRGPIAIPMLLMQQSLLSVFLYPALLWALWMAWRRSTDDRYAFLLWTALPALVIPLAVGATLGFVQATWAAPAYLGLAIALASVWRRGVGILVAGNALVLLYGLSIPLVPIYYVFADTVFGWDAAAARVQQELRTLPQPAVVVSDRYGSAAQIAYYLRDTVPATLLPDPDPASIWPPVETFRGANAVAVIDARWTPRADWTRYAARVEEAPPLTYWFHGRWPVRTFRILRLYGLKDGASEPPSPTSRP